MGGLALFAGLAGGSAAVVSDGVLAAANNFFRVHPFLASFCICAFKASTADCFAQCASFRAPTPRENNSGHGGHRASGTTTGGFTETVPSFNPRRTLAFLCYGGLYQGCGQELIYNHLFSALFGSGTRARSVVAKVCFDMLVVQPFLSLPIAYLIKAPIFGHSVGDALGQYRTDVAEKGLLKTCWKVWAPTQVVSFAIVPAHLRITFMACVSFFWIILFSTISSSGSEKNSERIKQQ